VRSSYCVARDFLELSWAHMESTLLLRWSVIVSSDPTSVASVPDWVDAALSWSRMMGSLCGLKLREASGTFGEVALGRCTQL